MKNEKIIKVVATGILVAGLVGSSGGLALAAGNSANGPVVSPPVQWLAGNPGAQGPTTGPVIMSTSKAVRFNQNILKEALAGLVTAGTVTRDQSDAVLEHFQNNTPKKPAIKVKQPSEGAINMDGPKLVVKVNDPLKDLVDKGSITEAQAQAIRDKMRDIAGQQMQQQWQKSLDTLVGKGTITRDQAGKILDFLVANNQKMQSVLEQTREDMQNMREQAKNMSPQERARQLKENLGNIKDPVSQMIDQGIITRQQANALRQAMPSLPKIVRIEKPSPDQLQANLDALAAQGIITQGQAAKIQAFLEANDQKVNDELPGSGLSGRYKVFFSSFAPDDSRN